MEEKKKMCGIELGIEVEDRQMAASIRH